MRPNLKKYSAKSIHINTEVALTNKIVAKLKRVSFQDEDGDYPFIDAYRNNLSWAWVIDERERPVKGKRSFSIQFNFERGGVISWDVDIKRLRKSVPRTEQLIDLLSSNGEELDFSCRLDFEFAKNLKPKPMFNLPIKYAESPDYPFDDMCGVHLRKLDGKAIRYEVILEGLGDGKIMITVFFVYKSKMTRDIVERILEEGSRIASAFVTKGA